MQVITMEEEVVVEQVMQDKMVQVVKVVMEVMD